MENSAEKIEQEINMSDDPVEIEIIDDTPEADRKPKRDENVESKIPDDDEVAKYGTDVQKRIKQLKYEYHEERRQKEEATRLREEAISATSKLMSENQRLRKTIKQNTMQRNTMQRNATHTCLDINSSIVFRGIIIIFYQFQQLFSLLHLLL